MLNFHWLLLLFSSSFADVAVSALEASVKLLTKVW